MVLTSLIASLLMAAAAARVYTRSKCCRGCRTRHAQADPRPGSVGPPTWLRRLAFPPGPASPRGRRARWWFRGSSASARCCGCSPRRGDDPAPSSDAALLVAPDPVASSAGDSAQCAAVSVTVMAADLVAGAGQSATAVMGRGGDLSNQQPVSEGHQV